MNRLISLTAFAFAILALISICAMIYAMMTSGGMAVLAFQMWATISALAALGLGFASYFMTRQAQIPQNKSAKLSIGLGALSLIVLIIAKLFF